MPAADQLLLLSLTQHKAVVVIDAHGQWEKKDLTRIETIFYLIALAG